MYILENVPLSGYSTMRLGGPARYLTEISDRNEVGQAVAWARERQLPLIMIGVGSNIVWRDEGYPGLVLVNKIMGFETYNIDSENAYITVGGGEIWDSVVERVVQMGYSGIEQLSLIPGTAGATPVQNVGAYGREIADVLATIEAFDTQDNRLITMPAGDCQLTYRSSRFKTTDRGRFLISSITFNVTKAPPQPPFYRTLDQYLTANNITQYTAQIIRDAVVAIRSAKLPDPALVANNGSFFANPIINQEQFSQLHAQFPAIHYWQTAGDDIKLSGGWLIEEAGFKEVTDGETGMATWPGQALVLVNKAAGSTANLLKFKQKIVDAVATKFGITLVQEPELLP